MTAWKPLFDGEAASTARTALATIADALPEADHAHAPDLALWWAYAADVLGDDARYDRATEMLVDRIAIGQAELHLHGGLAGAGWVLAHITDGVAEDVLGTIDAAIAAAVSEWTGSLDLMSGLAGIAVYLLERLPASRESLARVIDCFASRVVADDQGFAWEKSPGVIDCGVAHGVPGIVSVLARIATLPGAPERAVELCRGGLAWMATQRREPHPHAWFPASVNNGQPTGRPRNAWCYGDPGVAVALWSAASRIGEATDLWRDTALAAAARPASSCEVEGAGFCHGAMGLSHLFTRCFHAAGNDAFRTAAQQWFARGLVAPPDGVDIVNGAVGRGLVILAALQNESPRWDTQFACDLPPMDHAAGGSDSV